MKSMNLLAFAVCSTDAALREQWPFPCGDIDRESIPVMLRRRSSQAMQLAFSAAIKACKQTEIAPINLPTLFASVAGEIQTTDQLCHELVKADGLVSPSAFHNSVQNTVAGYWSIAHQSTQAATALAAGRNTCAMALQEAWCQLAVQGGDLLVVCYDERWPDYLAPGLGQSAAAIALLLTADDSRKGLARLGRPQRLPAGADSSEPLNFCTQPILEIAPLLGIVAAAMPAQNVNVALGSEWAVSLTI